MKIYVFRLCYALVKVFFFFGQRNILPVLKVVSNSLAIFNYFIFPILFIVEINYYFCLSFYPFSKTVVLMSHTGFGCSGGSIVRFQFLSHFFPFLFKVQDIQVISKEFWRYSLISDGAYAQESLSVGERR